MTPEKHCDAMFSTLSGIRGLWKLII